MAKKAKSGRTQFNVAAKVDCPNCMVALELVDRFRGLLGDEREQHARELEKLQAALDGGPPSAFPARTGASARSPRPAPPVVETDPRERETAFSQPPDVIARLEEHRFRNGRVPFAPVRSVPAPVEPPLDPLAEAAANAEIADAVAGAARPIVGNVIAE